MKLYFHPMSSNARRATMTAHELKSPVEMVFVDLQKGEQRAPAYLDINVNAKVPALDDDGFHLNESYAIMIYLAEKAGPTSLYPVGLKERADVQRWLFWCANEFSPPVAKLNFEHILKAMFGQGAPDPARVLEAETVVKRLGGILDKHLATHTWMCGDTFTLADIAVACSLQTMVPAKLPVGDLAHLQAWFKRVESRDAWKATAH